MIEFTYFWFCCNILKIWQTFQWNNVRLNDILSSRHIKYLQKLPLFQQIRLEGCYYYYCYFNVTEIIFFFCSGSLMIFKSWICVHVVLPFIHMHECKGGGILMLSQLMKEVGRQRLHRSPLLLKGSAVTNQTKDLLIGGGVRKWGAGGKSLCRGTQVMIAAHHHHLLQTPPMSWFFTVKLVWNIFLRRPPPLLSDSIALSLYYTHTHAHTHRGTNLHSHTQATLFMSLKISHTYFHWNKEPRTMVLHPPSSVPPQSSNCCLPDYT